MKVRKKYKTVYLGRSVKAAKKASDLFWKDATPEQRMKAITEMIEHVILIKGGNPDALRLCRSTAVIKRTQG